jgi:hypothetical protein
VTKAVKRHRALSRIASIFGIVGVSTALAATGQLISPWWAVAALLIAYTVQSEAYWLAALWGPRS